MKNKESKWNEFKEPGAFLSPKWSLRFLRFFIKKEYLEEIEGDMEEIFRDNLSAYSEKLARRKYFWELLKLLRPALVKNLKGIYHLNQNGMWKNHFRVAWRSMAKQKTYAAIKIGGFAIGIAACLLITLFIRDELSYDQHFPDKERIYRVVAKEELPTWSGYQTYSPAIFARTLMDEFPEVEYAGRLNLFSFVGAGSNEVSTSEKKESTHEENVAYADQELLEILQPTMVEGNLHQALTRPNTIVITKSKAKQYFPEGMALGKLLILNGNANNPYRVSGVIEDFPKNCHLECDFLISLKDREFWTGEQTDWADGYIYHTYLKLSPHTDITHFESKLEQIVINYVLPAIKDAGYVSQEAGTEARQYTLQPIEDIHLRSSHIDDDMIHGDIKLVQMFGAIAGFILLLACTNFTNLATARSANRGKEVGLRKTLGSARKNLMTQFLVESILLSMISFVIGLSLARLALPYFNVFLSRELDFPWTEWWLVPGFIAAACLVGLLSGLYPSVYLSAFKPVQVLKGNLGKGIKSSRLRNGLVVFQFSTAIVLIFGTVVVNRQMDFILNKNLGFEKDQVILLQGANTLGKKVKSLKNELLKFSGIEHVTVSDYLPITGSEVKRNGYAFWLEGKTSEEINASGQFWQVDEDYVRTFGMEIVEGRDFADDVGNNRGKVIVNTTLKRMLGLEDPIGARIWNGENLYEIVGVIEDFHFESMKEDIQGLCMVIGNSPSAVVSVKAGSSDFTDLLQFIERTWLEFSPDQPLRYTFLDQRFAMMYQDIKQTERIVSSFSMLAIVVACLGLFGLSAFVAEQRGKEMTIRKVLGASEQNIFSLLTINFLKLVFVSAVIAMPVAWMATQQWLDDFVYRTRIAWWVFVLAGIVAFLVALLTVSRQALKVAFSNPADALRNE